MNVVPKSYYLFLFIFFVLSSCNKETKYNESTKLDSLLQIVSDSLSHNPTYSYQILNDAASEAADSMQYYLVKEK